MTGTSVDAAGRGGYLRGVKFQRPSRAVTLATVAASAVLAAGGFVVGSRSDEPTVPASVPFNPVQPAQAEGTIVVPDPVDLPRP